jgi:ribonuclease-3
VNSLEQRLEYSFKNKGLLKQALTHASCSGPNNERFEFLGDRIVGFCISEWLVKEYPDAPEGELSKRLAAMVCGETLAQAADNLNVGEDLQLGTAEAYSRTPLKRSMLADAFEALMAAIYLDSDMQTVRSVIIRLLEPFKDSLPLTDPKSALQEWLQARSEKLPTYKVIEEDGPSHAPHFTVEVQTENHGTAQGEGRNKRSAEQAAATQLMEKLENDS